MALASERTRPVHLELGGKAPFVVFADADVEAVAAAAALAATYNSGQDCTAATRCTSQSRASRRSSRRPRRSHGCDRGWAVRSTAADIGPLITAAHRERVDGFVQRAGAAGADESSRGGRAAEGDRLVLRADTRHRRRRRTASSCRTRCSVRCWQCCRSTSEDEAVALANDSRYGLASSVWTSQVDRALRVAHRIEAGVTWVNDHLPIASEMPHGGRGSSGFGKDMGHDAVLEFTVGHHVMVKHAEPASVPASVPHDAG